MSRMVYYASQNRPALATNASASDIDMADSAGHLCSPTSCVLKAKGQLSSAAKRWAVPLFAKPYNSASRIANPAPAQATLDSLPSAGRVQPPNSEAAATVVARSQHKNPVLVAALAQPAGGRINKRKSRKPTRSPLAHDIPSNGDNNHGLQQHPSQLGYQTVKINYVDEYRRNPTAYSRALMDLERPGTHDGSSHLLWYASSHNADLQNIARHASVPRSRHSAPASPPKTQLLPLASVPILRKSVSETIRRLFPTLREPNEVLSAASQVEARSVSPNMRGHRAGLTASVSTPALGYLALLPPSLSLDIGDIQAKSNNSLQHVTSSGTNSGASTPQSSASADHSGMLSGTLDLDDELSREILALRPTTNSCSVKWTKAAPMDVSGYPKVELLAAAERECCSILRLLPEQYLIIKQSLVRAGRTLPKGTFKKRDAQKLCRVDVNKTSKVFEWFCKLEWIPQASTRLNHSPHQPEVGQDQQMLPG
ncbi:hypothetical protein GGI20_005067 [Coemansia sp. BCRC 34301]|nr:hypothetical protein GGI20_005067 [Coemansia sp. BCRC 34301]